MIITGRERKHRDRGGSGSRCCCCKSAATEGVSKDITDRATPNSIFCSTIPSTSGTSAPKISPATNSDGMGTASIDVNRSSDLITDKITVSRLALPRGTAFLPRKHQRGLQEGTSKSFVEGNNPMMDVKELNTKRSV